MHDLRDAIRSLRAAPLVTAIAVLSLGLGIGANTAIFSILDNLVLKSLPVREPDRLAILRPDAESPMASWTNPIWEQIRDRQSLVDGALAWSTARFNLSRGGQTEYIDGLWVSGRLFDVLGVPAVLGRTLADEDDARGGGPDGAVAVISYAFWQRRFGGDPEALGRSLTIERVPYTIVGVTPPDFFGLDVGRTFDVAVPLGTEPLQRGKDSALDHRSMWWLGVMVRPKPGQTIEQATLALRGVQPQIREATLPDHYRPQDRERYLAKPFLLEPAATGQSFLRVRYQRPLTTIMVVVALVLLIACANIANLLLARATARRHELSVRVALGASRWRVARQLLVESVMLSAAGALLGLAFAYWGSRLLVRQLSTQTSTVFLDLALDWRLLGFTAALAIGTAILFGTAPAWRATRARPGEALKEQGRTVAGERRWGLGQLLVVAQVALSLVLLVAAGLFVRSFVQLASVPLGFDRDKVLVVSVNPRSLQLESDEQAALYERLRDAVGRVPGVEAAAVSAVTPVSGSTWQSAVELPHRQDLSEEQRSVHVNMVSPGFFRAYGTPLQAGRAIDEQDTAAALQVVVVNDTFVRKFFDGRPPVGHTIRQGFPDEPAREIVGVVADAVYRSLREPIPPTIYVPIRQSKMPPFGASLSVRAAAGSPALLTRSVAAAITEIHSDVAFTFRPLADQVDSALIQERIVAMLSGFFGALALLLAGLGLYGITSYAVSRRQAEIGIRMALGAAPARVVWLVLRRVALLVGLGAVLGGAVSWWAGRFVETLLFGLQARDLTTLAGAIAVLALIGLLAGWLPARRAGRVELVEVLRG